MTKLPILNKQHSHKSPNFLSSIRSVFLTLLIITAFLASSKAVAQNNKILTAFEKADLLISENKLEEAYQLMRSYQKWNPKDFNAAWKTAQIAYWNKDMTNSKLLYETAIKLDETNNAVKYDYAKMLFENGNYKEASILFNQYRKVESENTEVWLYSIKSFYYNNDLSKAADLVKQMPKTLYSNPELKTLRNEILDYNALNIGVSVGYIDDNQPLETLIPKLQISKMHNSYFNWYLEGSFNKFSNDTLSGNSQTLKIGNKFTFNKLKLNADVSIGTTMLPVAEKSAVIGGLLLSKKIVKGVALNAEFSRNPYYYSLPSTLNFVLQDNAGIALSITDIKKFSGNLQYQKQRFNDDNSISAASFWFLSPSIGTKTINAKIGYAFESMDSEKDNFTSLKSVDEVIQNFGTTTTIEGIYRSYFTPQNQKIHSALLNVQLKLSSKVAINLSGSYGFNAKWENPYLFLNEDSSNQLFIDKNFVTEKFNPATYKADFNFVLTRKLNLGLNYNYFKTAFYTANTFLVNLNYKLISEK